MMRDRCKCGSKTKGAPHCYFGDESEEWYCCHCHRRVNRGRAARAEHRKEMRITASYDTERTA